jgi:uncharacterized protein with HEPN domain
MTRILDYAEGMDILEFKQSHITVDAVVRNFEIIGEASKNLPDQIKEKYPEIPWRKMYGLRNLISHEYFGVDRYAPFAMSCFSLKCKKPAISNR